VNSLSPTSYDWRRVQICGHAHSLNMHLYTVRTAQGTIAAD